MEKVAVISTIMEAPTLNQHEFNTVVSDYKGIVKGRLGVPFEEWDMAVISLTVVGSEWEILELSEKLDQLDHVSVKTVLSKKDVNGLITPLRKEHPMEGSIGRPS